MVLTVTANPMLDKTIYLEDFQTGKIWRSNKVENVAGGKGINVTRQLKTLGVESVATGFLGGEIGKIIKNILDDEILPNDFIFINDTTRIGFTVLEENTLRQTSVFEPGHKVSMDEQHALIQKCIELSEKNKWLVISGSVPDPSLQDIYKNIIHNVKTACPDIKIVLDSYGSEFFACINEKPFMLKQNKNEYEKTFKMKFKGENDFIPALENLGRFGKLSIITDGAGASYFSYLRKKYKAYPPAIKVVNPIGSGDSMTAGIIFGFLNDWKIENIIRFGIACGSANASVWEIAKCKREEIEKFLNDVVVEEI